MAAQAEDVEVDEQNLAQALSSADLFEDSELGLAYAAFKADNYLDDCLDSSDEDVPIANKKGHLEVCMSCAGSEVTLSDLEELCAWTGLHAEAGGCFGACGAGPNVSIVVPATSKYKHGTWELHSFVNSLDQAKELVQAAIGQESIKIPKEAERRLRMRSDALRLLNSTDVAKLRRCKELLTGSLECELADELMDNLVAQGAAWGDIKTALISSLRHASDDDLERLMTYHQMQRSKGYQSGSWTERLRKLRMMRAQVCGGVVMRDYSGAIEDLDTVIEAEPRFAKAYISKAKVLRRSGEIVGALSFFRKAIEVGSEMAAAKQDGFGLDNYTIEWIQRIITELEERLQEDAAIKAGEFGAAHAGDDEAEDSGDGSGRWKVAKIEGYAVDTAVYHLTNHRPAQPHPLPHHAWHVNVRFGSSVREYTPISTAAEWERGQLKLLVKTYGEGKVSKKFALLRQPNESEPLGEQNCWVLVSVPILTMALPSLAGTVPAVVNCPSISHLALVVGGTGIAPALQILRELVAEDGAFGLCCEGTLLYSSHTASDVLCIDELRSLQALAPAKIRVRHTLTKQPAAGAKPKKHPAADYRWVAGRHYHFTSQWQPYKPASGPLEIAKYDDEAGLRGRIDRGMMMAELPPAADDVAVIVCGPPSMWEDMREVLLSLRHNPKNLIELKALSEIQVNEHK